MELHRLRMKNFRQYANAEIRFDRGLTGIIGTNGAGKSTILEAIAFALYGVSAARGSKDSIKFRRAAPRASVSVELEFTLGVQRVRVERGLSTASAFLGNAETPVATSLGGVTDWIERTVGMTRAEFFTTYFTGQKELAVMGALGPADRARFLSRVLGYDRLETAQELVREARRGLNAEAAALRLSMPDAEHLEQQVAEAEQRTVTAHGTLVVAESEQTSTAEMLASVAPAWQQAQAVRAEQMEIEAKHGALTLREEALARDVLRLQRESDEITQAQTEVETLERDLTTLPALREEGARLDRDAAADTERQRLLGVRAHLESQAAALPTLEAARAGLASTADELAQATERATEFQADVTQAEARVASETALWRDQLATAKAELQHARAAVRPIMARKDALVARGPDAPCSTCGVALGDRYASVLADIEAEIAAATDAGRQLAERADALEQEPATLVEWRTELVRDRGSLAALQAWVTEKQTAQREAQRVLEQRERTDAELARIAQQIAALPTTYDVARHDVVRAELARLAPAEARRAVLRDKIAGAARVADALSLAETQARSIASERATLETRLQALGLTPAQYEAARVAHGTAEQAWRAAVDAQRVAKDAAERADEALAAARRRVTETEAARARLAALSRDVVLHEELDRAMGELRADLNGALRPELAEIASGLLDVLTDGRYTHAEFGEDYQLTVVEDGLVKPVISGGEEDLCNLVLRLAISQMIAERSGTPFSLLILDEVFSALDEQRRANVLTLLRRLGDRFAQVVVITHNPGVRDALDNHVRVTLDLQTGESRVSYGEQTDGVIPFPSTEPMAEAA